MKVNDLIKEILIADLLENAAKNIVEKMHKNILDKL